VQGVRNGTGETTRAAGLVGGGENVIVTSKKVISEELTGKRKKRGTKVGRNPAAKPHSDAVKAVTTVGTLVKSCLDIRKYLRKIGGGNWKPHWEENLLGQTSGPYPIEN